MTAGNQRTNAGLVVALQLRFLAACQPRSDAKGLCNTSAWKHGHPTGPFPNLSTVPLCLSGKQVCQTAFSDLGDTRHSGLGKRCSLGIQMSMFPNRWKALRIGSKIRWELEQLFPVSLLM